MAKTQGRPRGFTRSAVPIASPDPVETVRSVDLPEPAKSSTTTGANPDRITAYLKSDGSFDFDRMHASTKGKIEIAIGKSPKGPETTSDDVKMLAGVCAQGVIVLSALAAQIADKRGYANGSVLVASPQEADAIGSATVAVLQKYGAQMKYAEEFMLIMAVASVFTPKIMALQARPAITPEPLRMTLASPADTTEAIS